MQWKRPLLRPGVGRPPSRSLGSQAGRGGFPGRCGDGQAGCRGQNNCALWVSPVASSYKQSALHNKGDLFSDVTEKSRPREGGR